MKESPQRILVAGASGGLGQAMLRALLSRIPAARFDASHFASAPPLTDERVTWRRIDLRDGEDVDAWARDFDRVDWVINCAGFLHDAESGPEKSIRAFDVDFLWQNIAVNTVPSLLLARAFDAPLKRSPCPLLAAISARVGSIEDNRLGGWYSYRMSKAALNMALKTLSIEWQRSHPQGCVAALHPGTNDTALSKPFQANVRAENLFRPDDTAASLVDLLTGLDAEQSGRFFTWDGESLPW